MKAVFLDRDGTVIVDPPDERVDRVEKIQLLENTLAALKLLAGMDYEAFFITNQAGIGEGRITYEEFQEINAEVLNRLQPSGIKILKTFVCPHVSEDDCECRKPQPKMILDAAKEFDIDLSNSWMIGDRESDIMAGVNAGTKTILVKTGNVQIKSPEADYTADNLVKAVQYIAEQG
jgi:D-glycero-D-manno-heptose 1,7-bisphosphate phosphatase